jgi:hypothetical protein
MRLTFQTARECIKDLEAKVWKVPYGHGRRPKETQVQCQACKRWKYADERCNLFTTANTPQHNQPREQS